MDIMNSNSAQYTHIDGSLCVQMYCGASKTCDTHSHILSCPDKTQPKPPKHLSKHRTTNQTTVEPTIQEIKLVSDHYLINIHEMDAALDRIEPYTQVDDKGSEAHLCGVPVRYGDGRDGLLTDAQQACASPTRLPRGAPQVGVQAAGQVAHRHQE